MSDPGLHSFDQVVATIKSRISEHAKARERLERAREEVIAPFSDQIEATVDEAYAGARGVGPLMGKGNLRHRLGNFVVDHGRLPTPDELSVLRSAR